MGEFELFFILAILFNTHGTAMKYCRIDQLAICFLKFSFERKKIITSAGTKEGKKILAKHLGNVCDRL